MSWTRGLGKLAEGEPRLAERVGFEPTCRFWRQDAFEAPPLRPLRYLSGQWCSYQLTTYNGQFTTKEPEPCPPSIECSWPGGQPSTVGARRFPGRRQPSARSSVGSC